MITHRLTLAAVAAARVDGDDGLRRRRRERPSAPPRPPSRPPAASTSTSSPTPCPKPGWTSSSRPSRPPTPARACSSSSPTAPRATSRARSPPEPRPTSSTSRSSPTSPAWSRPAWSTRLERRRHQGHPVRLGRDHRRAQGQPQGHQGLGRPAASPASRSSPRTRSAPARPSGTCSRRTPPRATAARTTQAGLDYIDKLVTEHVKIAARSPAARRPRRSCRAPATCCSATRTRRSSSSARATRSSTSPRRRPSRSRTRSPCVTTSKHLEQATALQRTSCTPRRPEAVGRGRASARSTRPSPRSSPKDFPAPEKLWTIADLGGWKRRSTPALFDKDNGSHRQDLRRRPPGSDAMTRPRTRPREAVEPAPSPDRRRRRRPPGGAPARRASGTRRCGVGVGDAVAERHRAAAAGGAHCRSRSTSGWQAFWDAVTAPAALAVVPGHAGRLARSSPLINVVFGHAGRLGAGPRRVPRQAARRRAHRPAVRAADDRGEHGAARALRPEQPGRHPPQRHPLGLGRRAAVRHAAVRRALGAAGAASSSTARSRRRRPRWAPTTATIFRTDRAAALAAGAAVSGAGLAFARAIGEYGSVVLIGGAIPRETEVVLAVDPDSRSRSTDRAGAAAVSVVLLAISFVVLFMLRAVGPRARQA